MNRNAYRHLVCRMTPGLYLAALFIVTGPAADAEPPRRERSRERFLTPMVRRSRAPGLGEHDRPGRDDAGSHGPGRAIPARSPSADLSEPIRSARRRPGLRPPVCRRGSYSVYSGVDADLGTIQLDRGGVFTGRVLDADGTPCPNARDPLRAFAQRAGSRDARILGRAGGRSP